MSVKSKGVSLKWFDGYDIALLGDIHLQQIGNHVAKINDDGTTSMSFAGDGVTWDILGRSSNRIMENSSGTTAS
jgi:hypothetical protein